jgi:hypothetical protein
MEMERGKINWFFIDTRLKWDKYNPDLIYINASEEEFNDLLENYVNEIESEGKDFNLNFFRNYVLKNGYYCSTEPYNIIPPYAPIK